MNSEKQRRGRPKGIHKPVKYATQEERQDAIRRSKT